MNLVASTLTKRRLGEPRQAARDLGLAAPGRADHQDVLGQHLLAQLGRELLAAPAVAQRDRDRTLGVVLADDEAVELGDDLARTEGGHHVLRHAGSKHLRVSRMQEMMPCRVRLA